MSKIVIIEDELIAAEYLKEFLENDGFEVVAIIDNGKEALEKIPQLAPDMVLMDIMLKDGVSGSEGAVELKLTAPNTAIVFLTAYVDDETVEYAKNSNCCGYLLKPYNEKEILTNMKLFFAKSHLIAKGDKNRKIQLTQDIYFDRKKSRLFKKEEEVELNSKALLLFELLSQNPNITVSNEQISSYVWKEKNVNPTTIRTLIHKIKEKIGEDLIKNINRLGYKIVPQEKDLS